MSASLAPWLTPAFILMAAPQALAHRDDYLDETFVYQTVESGELELEAWAETHHPLAGPNIFVSTLSVECGLTSRWMADVAFQWDHPQGARTVFGRFRAETRYRFSEEGRKAVDLAISSEYELVRLGNGLPDEQELSPRLILSKDLWPKLNTTLNLDFPYEFSSREISFSYALGLRYPAESVFRIGAELRHKPSDRQATILPQIWYVPQESLALKLGLSEGLTARSEPWFLRFALEIEI